jgi:endonuclease/exonuclease/phosphatase (EEP) superfamily protein YafD
VDPAPRGGRSRRLLPVLLAIALPWVWFLVRDVGGPLDTVAVGLPLIGVSAIVSGAIVAVITGRAWPLAAGTSIFVVCALAVAAPRFSREGAPPDPAIRLVMANVWDANPTPEAVPASMLERRPDVMVAVEMPGDAFYDAMTSSADAAALPWTVDDGELGVWSKFPVRELGDLGLPPARVMRVGVDAPGTPFVLYVVHALNPLRDTSFTDQRRFTDDLLAAIASEARPVVIAGDFNMSDRVVSYRSMDAALIDAMRVGEAGRTTYAGGWWTTVLLRIDHIFVDRSWCADGAGTFVTAGSDHRGVEAEVGPCA